MKKIKLEEIKIKSFTTFSSKSLTNTVKGGSNGLSLPDCPSNDCRFDDNLGERLTFWTNACGYCTG